MFSNGCGDKDVERKYMECVIAMGMKNLRRMLCISLVT